MTKQSGSHAWQNKSLEFYLLHLSGLLHQYKIRKVKTINNNVGLVADLHVCVTVTSNEEVCIRTESGI